MVSAHITHQVAVFFIIAFFPNVSGKTLKKNTSTTNDCAMIGTNLTPQPRIFPFKISKKPATLNDKRGRRFLNCILYIETKQKID